MIDSCVDNSSTLKQIFFNQTIMLDSANLCLLPSGSFSSSSDPTAQLSYTKMSHSFICAVGKVCRLAQAELWERVIPRSNNRLLSDLITFWPLLPLGCLAFTYKLNYNQSKYHHSRKCTLRPRFQSLSRNVVFYI